MLKIYHLKLLLVVTFLLAQFWHRNYNSLLIANTKLFYMAQSTSSKKKTSSSKTSSTKKTNSKGTAATQSFGDTSENSMLSDFFIDELKDIYWAEKHLVKALPKLQRAANSEELQQAIKNHIGV